MPHKDIKDREEAYLSITKFIEQPQFSEVCPCGSQKIYGACCGQDMPCSCHSHLSAGECCYTQKTPQKSQSK